MDGSGFVFLPLRLGRGLNDRWGHYAQHARIVKAERESIGLLLNTQRRPALPLTIVLTREAPSTGLDGDNLEGSLKATRDAVAAWLGVDDADPRIVWQCAQRRAPWGVRIEWEPLRA